MRAFIIRPFGVKQDIDFDAVARELIDPALARLGIAGRDTIEILKAGNIRIDMFQRLLTADLVVADLSIHNANVFYELGIRHALRDKRTFLLRSESDAYPFDLQTDRYFVYKKTAPAASLDDLIKALDRTLASEDQDSPVFRSLPDLQVQDRSRFLPVPADFREEVERAAREKRPGDLELLAAEVQGFPWESEGLRLVGRAQFDLKDHAGARATWEAVRATDADDLEANRRLGTIYQRLGNLTESDIALGRVLDRRGVDRKARAEARSLQGRNAKTRWVEAWRGSTGAPARERALRSPYLRQSADAYADAFNEDLNHFYSGLNALAMLKVTAELAAALPAVWADRFDSDTEAERALGELRERVGRLTAGVELALAAEKARLKREDGQDIRNDLGTADWIGIGTADLCCLTARRPSRVAEAYREALAGVPDFAAEAARDQLKLYRELGVLADNVDAALSAFPPEPIRDDPHRRVLLFTGHMVDTPDRTKPPRFPPAMEAVARQKIKETVQQEMALPGGVGCGIAGGASGGDILFHEVCAELGIPTWLYLALPRAAFVAASVAPAGPQSKWIERFDALYERPQKRVRVLADSETLPPWLHEKPNYDIWQRNNLWMLYNALAIDRDRVTLIALWDGEPGDGPGGTGDLVQRAKAQGAKPIVLDTREIFGLPGQIQGQTQAQAQAQVQTPRS